MSSTSRPSTTQSVGPRDTTGAGRPGQRRGRSGFLRRTTLRTYSYWFYAPAGVVYAVIFIVPTVVSFYFAFTRWTLFESEWIGLDNFRQFFSEQQLRSSLGNTLFYATFTSGMKVIFGMIFAVVLTSALRSRGFLRSIVFFPVLVSIVAVGITWRVLLNPRTGIVNGVLSWFGITGPDWVGNPSTALLSVAIADVWSGVGLATVIYIAGLMSIPREYYEAAEVDGASGWSQFWRITLPLARPATFTVILLSLIGGLRRFDLIWTMTGGGPGFASDTIASVIYKQYQAGFYGLSTAGNVVLFVLVAVIIFPLNAFLRSKEVDL